MLGPPRGELLRTGRNALERADWTTARSAFTIALVQGDPGGARDGLAQAEWFLGRIPEAIGLREQVFAQCVRAGRCNDAARVAVWVAHQHMLAGRASAARGWLARSQRALAGLPECTGHGWVAIEQGRQATGVDEQARHAARALAVARRCGAEEGYEELEVLALSLLGRAEVRAGRREAGLTLLEEAMAAATAGRVRDLHTLGEAYCNLVLACSQAGDTERATEWCELVESFARDHAIAPLLGACRTVHADLLMARGHWAEAERALQSALEVHDRHLPAPSAPTLATLAELRVHQGRLADAERLLARREEDPASIRALALLRLAGGRPRPAVALLERGLQGAADDAVAAAHLLASLADARLAAGDLPGGRDAAADLALLAGRTGSRLLLARADLAAASVAWAAGDPGAGAEPACRALAAFSGLGMPFDAALARLALGRATAAVDRETARDQVRAALACFHDLGAVRAADAAAELLRRLTAEPGDRPRPAGALTGRAEEVLALIARGLSNAGIAEALLISQKTAGHHVSHILSKLGVPNRAAAAAYAARSATGTGPARW